MSGETDERPPASCGETDVRPPASCGEPDGEPSVRAYKHTFPYELTAPSSVDVKKLNERYTGYLSGSMTVGPSNYFVQGIYKNYAQHIYDFDFKPTDVIVASYPKTGTTWTQELVWLVVHGLDYEGAKRNLDDRFPFMEADWVIDRNVYALPELKQKGTSIPGYYENLRAVADMSTPRTIKTHMPFTLLPPDVLDTCKVIYVTRDPRDVLVSFYHHHKLIISHGFIGDVADFTDDFVNERIMYSPFYSHVREAHDRRKHPNLLIITYENMKQDLKGVITKVAQFLDVSISNQEKEALCQHLHFSSMKNNSAVNGACDPITREENFIRKGTSGGWRSQLNEEDQKKVTDWFRNKSQGLNEVFGWQE